MKTLLLWVFAVLLFVAAVDTYKVGHLGEAAIVGGVAILLGLLGLRGGGVGGKPSRKSSKAGGLSDLF